MHWSDIPWNPAPRLLRQFAGLWILFFVGLAGYQAFWGGHPSLTLPLLVLALTVGPLGLVRPSTIRYLFVGWMLLAFPIGWTVSHLMLGFLFYGIFTPVALGFKLAGRDVLHRRPAPDRATYWTPKPAIVDMRSYFRQF